MGKVKVESLTTMRSQEEDLNQERKLNFIIMASWVNMKGNTRNSRKGKRKKRVKKQGDKDTTIVASDGDIIISQVMKNDVFVSLVKISIGMLA